MRLEDSTSSVPSLSRGSPAHRNCAPVTRMVREDNMVANLTLLEQLGFEPTELERRVLGNPSFQWLYDYLTKNGWP